MNEQPSIEYAALPLALDAEPFDRSNWDAIERDEWGDDDGQSTGQIVPVKHWEPTDKQAEYLAASEFEVLFGGSAGGGKSEALVIDALGLWQKAIMYPDYRAIIFRPSFPELRELERRMQEIYPFVAPGAVFNKTDHAWKFPSGAEIYTSYLASDDDRYRFQTFEFQFIAFEELTQWATDACYVYLFSRLRSSNPNLKCVMRSNCNPGGRGHEWVKQRWGIRDHGGPTLSRQIVTLDSGETRSITRRFIPARLSDNPYLGADYEATLALLPAMEQRALRQGRWDVIEIPGAIYRAEIEACYLEGRITRVPYDPMLPVHTVWDLGMNDSMSIWFVQLVNAERRAIDYYANNGEGLAHYAKELNDRGYVYGSHWAPADIEVRELGTGVSRYETAQKLGINFQHVPALSRADGMHALRMMFPTLWFDAEKCAEGIKGLAAYRREYKEKYGVFSDEPIHDFASHPSDAARYMAVSIPMMNNSFNGWGAPLNYPTLSPATGLNRANHRTGRQ
jgi:hypothetical protein